MRIQGSKVTNTSISTLMRFEEKIRREQANIKIVMPTMSENNEDLFETIKSGGGHDSGGEDSTLNVFEFSRDKGVTKV